MLGTGNALVTECYNTCFVLSDRDRYFLVDGGGGNEVLHRLKQAGIDWKDIRDIFVTHKHIDHLLGIIWMVRLICQHMAKGKKLTCCGDEPYNECEKMYAENSTWLLHEAFCLYSEAEIFSPYEKHHSTVKDACELAETLGVKNFLLYHTEDKNIHERKKLYLAEGKQYYRGNLYVPDDMEQIVL